MGFQSLIARGLKMPLNNKTISEAIKQAKAKSGDRKFNQTVDLILDIVEIDMKAPEGKIREVVELPHVTDKPNKICVCLLYTSPSPRDRQRSRMPSSA